MKISYTFEQSEQETAKQEETKNMIIDKLVAFGQKVFDAIIQDKISSRQAYESDRVSELTHTISILSEKMNRIESKLNNTTYAEFKKNR